MNELKKDNLIKTKTSGSNRHTTKGKTQVINKQMKIIQSL